MPIIINFYEEKQLVEGIYTFQDLKQEIARLYNLDPLDVDELIFRYYDDENDIINISNEDDFGLAGKTKKTLEILLEISEKSRLFNTQLHLGKMNSCESIKIEEKVLTEKEKIENEIREKEELLKKIVEEEARKKQEQELKIKEEKEAEAKNQLGKLIEQKRLDEEKIAFEKLKEVSSKKIEESKINVDLENERMAIINDIVKQSVEENFEKMKNKIMEETIKGAMHSIEGIFNVQAPKTEGPAVHNGVRCDGCSAYPIRGIRYKCTTCHNFDYCEKCEEANASTHNHAFLKIRNPDQNRGCPYGRPFKPFRGVRKFFNQLKDNIEMTKIEKKEKSCKKRKTCETKDQEISIEKTEKKEETLIENNEELYKVQAEEIIKNFQLDGIDEAKVLEVLKMYGGDYDKTVAELFNLQSIIAK